MHFGRIIPAALALAAVCGCAGPESRGPWDRGRVPVTPPKEQAKLPPARSAAEGPAAIESPRPAPAQASPLADAATSAPAGRPAAPPADAAAPRPIAAPGVLTPVTIAPGTSATPESPPVVSASEPSPVASASSAPADRPVGRAASDPLPPPGFRQVNVGTELAPAPPTDANLRLSAAQLPGPVRLEDLPYARTPHASPTPAPSAVDGPAPSVVEGPKPSPTPTPAPSAVDGPAPSALDSPAPERFTPTVAVGPTPATGPAPARTEIVSTFGLQVNNKYITVEDILRSAAGELAELPPGLSEATFRERASQIISRAVRTQVEIAVILPEAEAKLSDDDAKKVDQEIDKTLRALIAEAGGSRKKLEEAWIQRGTTLDQVLKEQRRRLIVGQYLHAKIVPDIQVNRKMLYDYYLRHKAEKYTTGRKVQMQIVAVPFATFLRVRNPSAAELAAARLEANDLIRQADAARQGGLDFTEVVKKYSRDGLAARGGVWPLMEAGSFKETAVEQAAFALEPGAVSDVIETPTGFYLVKVLKSEGGSVVSFEDAQEEIEKTLTDEQYARLHEKYIYSKAPNIASSARLQELALDKAVDRYWRK